MLSDVKCKQKQELQVYKTLWNLLNEKTKRKMKTEVLQAASDDTRSLVSERNSEIGDLRREIQKCDQTIDSLISAKATKQHEWSTDLWAHIFKQNLQCSYKGTVLFTFSYANTTCSDKNCGDRCDVMSCLKPSADINELRLPGKSCAAYNANY